MHQSIVAVTAHKSTKRWIHLGVRTGLHMTMRYRNHRMIVGAMIVALVVASGCGSTKLPSGAAERDSAGSGAGSSLDDMKLEVVGEYREPVAAIGIPKSDDLAVAEQGGRVITGSGSDRRVLVDFSSLVSSGSEQGLLGIALDASGRSMYLNFTDRSGDTRIVEVAVPAPGAAPVTTPGRELLRVDQPYSNHNGGMVDFGLDGRLYVGMGDGGSAGDPMGRAQDPRSMLGKLLAIDVDSGTAVIVARGLRNPWRFSFDRVTDSIWIGDVGQDKWEEINAVTISDLTGANFGWNGWEGSERFAQGAHLAARSTVMPIYSYNHREGCSVTGGFVYRGAAIPSLVGRYVFADYCSDWIASIPAAPALQATQSTEIAVVKAPGVRGIASFGLDSHGEILVCARDTGRVYRIVPE